MRGTVQAYVAVGRNGTVQVTKTAASGWTEYRDLGNPPTGPFRGDPSIVSWGPGRVDVFVRGADDKLWQRFSGDFGENWSDWLRPVGDDGVLASGPDVGTRGSNRLDVFVVGTDGNIYQRFWEGAWNEGWLNQGQPQVGTAFGSHPTALSMDGNRVDIYVQGADRKLWQKWWNGSSWSDWFKPVGDVGTLASSPDAASWEPTNVVIFVVGTDGRAYALPYGTGGWASDWIVLASPSERFVDSLGATSRGLNSFDVFGRGTDSALYQIYQQP